MRKPPALKPGDRVRLVAPASPFDRARFEAGRQVLARLGLEPVVGRREFSRAGFLAGSDEQRAEQLACALDEECTRAVWCIRGGYGTARLLPRLGLPQLRRHPKLLVGFSDVTALLLQLSGPGGFVTLHGPVITQLSRLPARDLEWLSSLLFGTCSGPARVPLGRPRTVVSGVAEGHLVAANLSILASLAGTPFAPRLEGSILCLEDVGEKAYRLDRLVWQIAAAGLLDGVRGIVLGELADCAPVAGPYSARRVLERAIAAIGVPTISGAAFGHADRNVALPLGVRARLDAGAGTLTLLESAVDS